MPLFPGFDGKNKIVYADYSGMRMVESAEMTYAGKTIKRTFLDASVLLNEWTEKKREHFDREFCTGKIVDAPFMSISNYNTDVRSDGNLIFDNNKNKIDSNKYLSTMTELSETKKFQAGVTVPKYQHPQITISSPLSEIFCIKRPIFLNKNKSGMKLRIKLANNYDMFFEETDHIKIIMNVMVLVGVREKGAIAEYEVLSPRLVYKSIVPLSMKTGITGGMIRNIRFYYRELNFNDKIRTMAGNTSVFECIPSSSLLFDSFQDNGLTTFKLPATPASSLSRLIYFYGQKSRNLINRTWWRHGNVFASPIIKEKLDMVPMQSFNPSPKDYSSGVSGNETYY